MTDKQIIKQLAERYKELCRSPFADGYTFTAFEGKCAEKGFTIDDIKNYIEKEKQERKAKRTESIKSLKEKLKAKEQAEEKLVKQIQTICDFINNRPETFKGINGSVDKIITDYAKAKEQECEELKDKLNCCFCNPHIELNDIDKQRKCIEVTECFRRQLDQLKSENDELKKILKVRIEDLCDSCGAGSMMPMPCKVYEKTLTEIKEIAKKETQLYCETWKVDGYNEIIQKISEVEK